MTSNMLRNKENTETTGKEVYNSSFFSRTVSEWKGLPSPVRAANNIEDFPMLLSNT